MNCPPLFQRSRQSKSQQSAGTFRFPLVILGCLVPAVWGAPAIAQSITPALDGTGTVVQQTGGAYTIQGGQWSGDRANQFHSFDRFGLNPNESATFIATPNLQNILGRVVGGNPSVINGLLQVVGGSPNLYLMNPAGIVFGANASLNVPAAFTATTATGIGFQNGQWFHAMGDSNYATLTGSPHAFAFAVAQPGAIANLGNLVVGPGQSLTLIGGTVLNTGTLTAPGGQITIAAVPGQNRVRLSQPGSLLSLEVTPLSAAPTPLPFTPPTLPQLLTGGNLTSATGVTVNADGTLQLHGSTVQAQPGSAIASGQMSVASPASPGQIAILGDRVSLHAATLDASGPNGGTVRIGGDYLGQGSVPNARFTSVDANSVIRADAMTSGNGGRVIVWADDTTNFAGTITARGGGSGGNGGFVETSGQRILNVSGGRVDASAVQGAPGTWLLDPTDITIVNGGVGVPVGGVFDPPTNSTIAPATIAAALDGGTNVTITTNTGAGGNGDITLTDPINQVGGGTASLTLIGRRFLRPGAATINLTSTGGLTFNLNQVNPEAAPPGVSIQNAINAIGAVAGPRTINLGTGTYTLGATINIDRSLTLNGVNAASTTVSGNNAVQVFNVSATNVTLNNLTIANANSGINGGGVGFTAVGGTLTINNSTFSNNRATSPIGFAGALDNGNAGTITVNNSTFTGNSANNGGAISNGFNGGTITINNSTFTGNSATNNGGAIINNADFGTVIVNASTLSGNSAQFAYGGGIFNSGTLTVSDTTLSSNQAPGVNNGGGAIANSGILTINGVTRITNNSGFNGGGILSLPLTSSTPQVTIESGTTIADNSATFGGGIYNSFGGSFNFTGSTLSGNSAANGGAIFNQSSTNFNLSNSSLINNSATATGGGIFNEVSGGLTLNNSTLSRNNASSGGGIFNNNGGTANINGSIISGNIASINGGGIQNSGTATIAGSTIDGNTATDLGGGIAQTAAGATLTITNSRLTNNRANSTTSLFSGGGAIVTNNGTTTIDNSTLSGNSTLEAGGAINAAGGNATVTIRNSTLTGNSAVSGGAIASSSNITIENSTISGNSASVNSGGLYNFFNTLTLINSTVTDNTASANGGGIENDGNGILTLRNSIVSGNRSPVGREIFSGNTITSGGNNLFGFSGNAGLVGVTPVASDIVPTVPINQILAPLGNYGGLTQTMALVPGSPAINRVGAGATAVDQRGVAAVGIRDIGAYESAGFALTAISGGNQSTTVSTPFPSPLVVGITEAAFNRPLPFAGATIQFVAPDSGASASLSSTTVTTDASGQASVLATANDIPGSYTVAARLLGSPDRTFQLDNVALPPPPPPPLPPEPPLSPEQERAIARALPPPSPRTAPPTGTVPPLSITASQIETIAASAENGVTNQFVTHLGLTEIPPTPTLSEAQAALGQIAAASGVQPAILYVLLSPQAGGQALSQQCVKRKPDEECQQTKPALFRDPVTGELLIRQVPDAAIDLQLLLVTPTGNSVLRAVPGVSRAAILQTAQTFRNEVADPSKRRTRSYLKPAQQLYQWIIAPIAPELKARNIGTIAFIMDTPLRFIPLAALHDGNQFLVEQYSLSLMPSLSLTNTQYGDIRSARVLGAGASTFGNFEQNPLPAVQTEIATILSAKDRWQGNTLLNDRFTVENVENARRAQPFGIIHLATHGEFRPGNISQSYIQFADSQLQLNQIRELGWNNPPAELVVLSACRMAVGDEEAELGFAGFAVKAGVKSVLASLWNVSDEGTMGLMVEFYQQLWQVPLKAEALRQAQIAMLRGTVRVQDGQLQWSGGTTPLPPELADLNIQSFSHPYFWSAFTMVGSPW